MSASKLKCKECHKYFPPDKVYSWKQTGTEQRQNACHKCVKDKQSAYRKTQKGREAESRASKRAYLKHKHKWIARAKARYAIKKGLIIKPKKCEVCEKVKLLQAHHEDYTKPLEVIFLCHSCHADADRFLEGKYK